MAWPREPAITINGVCLTEDQCMTVRLALGALLVGLQREGVRGDADSRALMQRYLDHATAVFTIMVQHSRQGA